MADTAPLPPAAPATAPLPLPSLAQYQRQRAISEFYRRALSGPAFYAIAHLLVCGFGGYFQNPLLAWPPLVLFAVFGVARWAHKPPLDLDDNAATQAWWNRHWLMVHAVCLLWCLVFFIAGSQEQSTTTPFIIASTATIAFSAASGETYSFAPRHALLTVFLMQVPALVYFLLFLPKLMGVTIVLVVYIVYQALHIRRRAREFRHQMEIEHTLLSSRGEIERLSRMDALTGVANRREYESAFHAHWHHAARSKAKLALLVLDLDDFKRINDSHGHAAGDACLRHVAGLLQQRFRRSSDLVARIGGEEFVVLLPDTDAAEALVIAEQVRAELADTPCLYDTRSITVTASIGAGAMLWERDATPQASFSRIDAACYAAKAQGRNRALAAAPQ